MKIFSKIFHFMGRLKISLFGKNAQKRDILPKNRSFGRFFGLCLVIFRQVLIFGHFWIFGQDLHGPGQN